MAYQNISGTTKKSFMIGPNGVLLSSKAVKGDDGKIKKFLVVRDSEAEDASEFKVELRDPIHEDKDSIYDSFIESSDIKSMAFTNNSLILNLRNGDKIALDKLLTGVEYKGEEPSTPDAITVFADENGNIKDSKKTFSDEIDDSLEDKLTDIIPSVKAVVGYVGEVSQPLSQRLDGEYQKDSEN